MKLQKLLLIFLASNLLSLINSSKNKQLFDFLKTEKLNEKNQNNETKESLFDAVSFSQLREKRLGKSNNKPVFSLFEDTKAHDNLENTHADTSKSLFNLHNDLSNLDNKDKNQESLFDNNNKRESDDKEKEEKKSVEKTKKQMQRVTSDPRIKPIKAVKSTDVSHTVPAIEKLEQNTAKVKIPNHHKKDKVVAKLSKKVEDDEKIIDTLKSEISSILNKNKDLSSEINNLFLKNEKVKSEDEIINKKLNNEQESIESLKKVVEQSKGMLKNELNEENKKISTHDKNDKINIVEINKDIESLDKNTRAAFSLEEHKLNELKTKVKTHSLIANDIAVENANVSNLKLKHALDINSKVKITENSLNVSNNFEIHIGNEKINLKELIENNKIIKKLTEKCGKSLENCKIVSNDVFQGTKEREDKILSNLKEIKSSTDELAKNRMQ